VCKKNEMKNLLKKIRKGKEKEKQRKEKK